MESRLPLGIQPLSRMRVNRITTHRKVPVNHRWFSPQQTHYLYAVTQSRILFFGILLGRVVLTQIFPSVSNT